jgi:hypothetical protein
MRLLEGAPASLPGRDVSAFFAGILLGLLVGAGVVLALYSL